jgi:hypothetical protein
MSKSDVFVESSKSRFEIASVQEVKLGVGGAFTAEKVGTLSGSDGGQAE